MRRVRVRVRSVGIGVGSGGYGWGWGWGLRASLWASVRVRGYIRHLVSRQRDECSGGAQSDEIVVRHVCEASHATQHRRDLGSERGAPHDVCECGGWVDYPPE